MSETETMEAPVKRRGRPPASGDGAPKAAPKNKSISVDIDLYELLEQTSDGLAPTLGFVPTMGQTLRYLIKNAGGGESESE